ncbi:MAG: biotin--[acetyl-CoA-carboxylase] ligase [Deltaproteobacteria bacterium]|nr:biotin--[acetyl-CoA-carboxylase] ligase [Deltaproteobacteria bacterium]
MSDDVLLAALESGDWRSGAEVAERLGVSRAAVWKRIERLRERGYAIEAVAGRGYRLLRGPDLLLPEAIARARGTTRFAGEIVHRAEVDSTSRLAADLARAGAAEGTTVVAESQTAGRGRLGRTWSSPVGVNLYLSMVLRPSLAPSEVTAVSLVAAIAVLDTIEETCELRAEIKWPNDVLLTGRKVCGILTELEAEAERVRFLVLGIGVNLNARIQDFPPELRRKASSLRVASGRRVDRVAFTGNLLRHLEEVYDAFLRGGFAAVRPRYESRHGLVGRRVRIEGGPIASGVVRGVDADGALLVETPQGVARVAAGEVSLQRAYRSTRG